MVRVLSRQQCVRPRTRIVLCRGNGLGLSRGGCGENGQKGRANTLSDLCTPELFGRNIDFAEAVGFLTRVCHMVS